MASKDTFSTQDFRSAAAEKQRAVNQKHKWAHGPAYGPGQDPEHPRPKRPYTSEPSGTRRDGVATKTFKARSRELQHAEIQEYSESGDSSAPEEIEEVSAAPEADGHITNSYDATQGPNPGDQVLSAAFAKALERHESATTDRLIKDEYCVIESEGELTKSKPKADAKAYSQPTSSATIDDDGFELV